MDRIHGRPTCALLMPSKPLALESVEAAGNVGDRAEDVVQLVGDVVSLGPGLGRRTVLRRGLATGGGRGASCRRCLRVR